MADLRLQIQPSGPGSATLSWEGDAAPEQLRDKVAEAAQHALHTEGYRRLEVSLVGGDIDSRRAVQRAGFRLEGVRREATELPDGTPADVVLFARLASDEVNGPTGFSGVMNAALPKKRVIAHVLMRDADGRVLLCDTHFKADWELPGGIVEPGEPPRVAAVREVREELGIDLDVGRLLVADWMPPYLGWEDAMELIFDGGVVTLEEVARYVLQPSEIRSVRLCTLGEAEGLVTALSHRRLTVATGLAAPATAYLEDGSAPGA